MNSLEIRNNLHTPNARWVAQYSMHIHGMKICGGAHLLSWCHLVDYIGILLIFYVNLMGQRSLLEDKT